MKRNIFIVMAIVVLIVLVVLATTRQSTFWLFASTSSSSLAQDCAQLSLEEGRECVDYESGVSPPCGGTVMNIGTWDDEGNPTSFACCCTGTPDPPQPAPVPPYPVPPPTLNCAPDVSICSGYVNIEMTRNCQFYVCRLDNPTTGHCIVTTWCAESEQCVYFEEHGDNHGTCLMPPPPPPGPWI